MARNQMDFSSILNVFAIICATKLCNGAPSNPIAEAALEKEVDKIHIFNGTSLRITHIKKIGEGSFGFLLPGSFFYIENIIIYEYYSIC